MRFRFGSEVASADVDTLGTLQRVVVDPESRQVVELVVEHGPFGAGEAAVAIGAVANADANGVRLELSPDQFGALPPFAADRNLAPPPDAANVDENEVTDPVDVPDVPPVGAATGVESIAFTPIVQETMRAPSRDQVIDAQTEVWATDGQIGHVHEVGVSDETGRITDIEVAEGFLFHHNVLALITAIASIQPGRIILNVEKSQLQDAPDD